VQSRGQHYALGVRSVAKEITFNCGDYCVQYLISGGIECSYSWISWVLRRCPLMSLLERWTGVMLKTSLSLRHLSGHIFYINDFFHCGLMHPSTFCTRHWMGPRKIASNRARQSGPTWGFRSPSMSQCIRSISFRPVLKSQTFWENYR